MTTTRVYLLLTLLTTLATSLIWGIDTIFLLNAGLSNAHVFLVNSGYMIGQLLFEVPTGVVADTWGRKWSLLIGCLWLATSTLVYAWLGVHHAPFWLLAGASALLGIGFTFFTGATEAWLVDELKRQKQESLIEKAFGQAQSVGGIAMLVGAVGGGVIAQQLSLPIPYILRAGLLGVSFLVALFIMKEPSFKPRAKNASKQAQETLRAAVKIVQTRPAVRWLVVATPFSATVGFYTFYAAQPFLLQLYGDSTAYSVAGLAAALVALSRVVGGWLVSHLPTQKYSKTVLLSWSVVASVLTLVILGTTTQFWIALAALFVWGLLFAMTYPIRQAFINQYIPSDQRATVLSIDSLVGAIGGVIIQPLLGRIADTYGYSRSFLAGAGTMFLAMPPTLLAGRQQKRAS